MPLAFRWVLLGLMLFEILGVMSVLRRLRAADPAMRFSVRLDLAETVGSVLLLGGGLLGMVVAEGWALLAVAGFALMTAGYGVKGVRWLRKRRRPAGPGGAA